MSFKDILVHIEPSRGYEERLRLAVALAARHDACLTGLCTIEDIPLAGFAPVTGISYIEIETLQAIQEKQREAALAGIAVLEQEFLAEARRAKVRTDWRVLDGNTADLMTRETRHSDLAVLGQVDPENPPLGSASRLPETVLLDSGRPVLVVPYVGHFESLGKNVMVAWNGSREAARAVNDALPILAFAEKVTVLTVNPDPRTEDEEGEPPAAGIVRHLSRHDVKAEGHHTVAEDIDVADVLLSSAADYAADLVVMGGYGHSRTREFILGGATRSVLRHMTVPVLMSH
jgi:nucleotide-binding universal stress UspA family protein